MSSDIDIAALHGFIDESNDSLQGIEAAFIDLENDPGNMEIINKIFRPVHSLKGNSGFFGLTNINKFSHRLENLLDNIRKGEVIVDSEVVDVLLNGVDYLQKMLNRAYEDPTDVQLRPDEEEFLGGVEKYRPAKKAGTIQSVIDFEKLLNEALEAGVDVYQDGIVGGLLAQIEQSTQHISSLISAKDSAGLDGFCGEGKRFFYEGREHTEEVSRLCEVYAAIAEKKLISDELIQAVREAADRIADVFTGDKEAEQEIDEFLSLSNFLDDELMISSNEFVLSLTKIIGSVVSRFVPEEAEEGKVKKLGEILVEKEIVSEEQLAVALGSQKKVGEILVEQGALQEDKLQEALTIQDRQALGERMKREKSARDVLKTIRIDQDKLDSFANFVGELFISLDSFHFLGKQLERESLDFEMMSKYGNTLTSLDDVIDKLHESIMNIRRLPLKGLFQRFPRVVRELAGSLGKNIHFIISGEETVVDKDLLEKIENPLVHMLRNSVDHGVETPEERAEKNKPVAGTISLSASADENYVYMVIKDDGKGIDPQKMKEVALRKGFMDEAELAQLSDKELVHLIFKPGFSTAEQISDVSGRGVGMDVAISTLRESEGTITVDSEVDQGTTVSIRIPLSTTLITKDAMIVESAGKTYAIPSEDISSTIEATDRFINLFNEDNCITYNGSVIKVIDVHGSLYPLAQRDVQEEVKPVIIVCNEYKIALLVDEVVSHQKIVVKSFTKSFKKFETVKGIGGYTILGNEDIVLLLDIQKIAEHSMA